MDRRNIESMAGATLVEILHSVRRNLGTAIVSFFVVTAVLATLVMLWPNRYVSDGLMYVRLGRGAVSVDPTAAQSSNTVSLMESREYEVNSVAKMLSSREIAERAVKRLGAEEVNRARNWVEDTMDFMVNLIPDLSPNKSGSGAMTAAEFSAQVELEDAIERVQEWVEISVPKDSHTVTISSKGTDPTLAQSVVQALMDEYQRFHVEAHRADGSLEFFEQQVQESHQVALQAREALEQAKNEMGWLSVASSEETLRERVIELESLRAKSESDCAEAVGKAKAIEARLASVEQWVPTEIMKGIATKAAQDMRTELFNLQVEGTEATTKFKPDHPRYRLVKEMMAQSASILAKEGKDTATTTEALNPIYQSLQGEYESTMARAIGLESGCETLRKSLAEAKSDMKRLNKDAITLSKLKWASDIAERNYLAHASSLEEARVSSALDTQEMSDVSVIQDASLNLKKAGPPRLIMLGIAVVLGVLASILLSIIRDGSREVERFTRESAVLELLAQEHTVSQN